MRKTVTLALFALTHRVTITISAGLYMLTLFIIGTGDTVQAVGCSGNSAAPTLYLLFAAGLFVYPPLLAASSKERGFLTSVSILLLLGLFSLLPLCLLLGLLTDIAPLLDRSFPIAPGSKCEVSRRV